MQNTPLKNKRMGITNLKMLLIKIKRNILSPQFRILLQITTAHKQIRTHYCFDHSWANPPPPKSILLVVRFERFSFTLKIIWQKLMKCLFYFFAQKNVIFRYFSPHFLTDFYVYYSYRLLSRCLQITPVFFHFEKFH